MLTVGDALPAVTLTGVGPDGAAPFAGVDTGALRGRWTVLFSWPKDFTFVCPTELVAFGERTAAFAELGADVYGVSVDNEYVHLAWRQHDPRLRDLPYVMLADVR